MGAVPCRLCASCLHTHRRFSPLLLPQKLQNQSIISIPFRFSRHNGSAERPAMVGQPPPPSPRTCRLRTRPALSETRWLLVGAHRLGYATSARRYSLRQNQRPRKIPRAHVAKPQPLPTRTTVCCAPFTRRFCLSVSPPRNGYHRRTVAGVRLLSQHCRRISRYLLH